MKSLVKNWCLSLFLIHHGLSVRSYLPTETWVPHTMIKQNFFFLYRWMGPRKSPKSSTAYILILMCYELSRLLQSFALSAAICENKDYQTQVYREDLGGPGIGKDVMLTVILGKRENFTAIRGHFYWVEIMWQGGHVAWQTIQFFSGICMKKSLVPRQGKRISYCPPTWPQWLQLQTSNTDQKLFVFKQKWLDICMSTGKRFQKNRGK